MTTKTAVPVPTRPLPPGSIISYAGDNYTIVEDDGGSKIRVSDGGQKVWFYWKFDGEECQIVSGPPNAIPIPA